MTNRNNISIKTRFETVDSCKQNCLDQVGKVRYASSMGKSLIGEVTDQNSFRIGSNQKSAATHEFIGYIVQKEDGIYMEGDIKARKFSERMIYLSLIFGVVFGIMLILSLNPVFVLFGILFMLMPWMNVIHLKKSNALYNLIIKKVK